MIWQYGAGAAWADAGYADAYFGLEHPSPQLPAYAASAGIYAWDGRTSLTWLYGPRTGVAIMGKVRWLTGSAASSPLVRQKVQPTAILTWFYRY